jgi:hypothetical protein
MWGNDGTGIHKRKRRKKASLCAGGVELSLLYLLLYYKRLGRAGRHRGAGINGYRNQK